MNINSVFLKDMPFHLSIGKDAWQREDKPQPVNITLRVDNVDSINDVATTDDISKSLDYGKLYKSIQSNLNPKTSYSNIQQIAHFVLASLIANSHDISGEIQIKLPKAALRAEGGLEYVFGSNRDQGPTIEHEFLHIRGIKCACIIGVNPHERRDKQIVIVNLTFRGKYGTASDSTVAGSNPSAADVAMNTHHEIVETVVEHTESSTFLTVESLASSLCRSLTMDHSIPEVEISVEKPYAIPSIGAAGVCIRRRKSFYAKTDFWAVGVGKEKEKGEEGGSLRR